MEETYYDAEEEGVTQTDEERVEDIIYLQNKYGLTNVNTVYLPHDVSDKCFVI